MPRLLPRPPRTFRYEPVRFPWRIAFYAVLLLYLSADLYVFRGPVARWVGGGRPPADDPAGGGWVARVYGQPITRAELDAAVRDQLARHGATLSDYAPGQGRLALHIHVLENLIEARVLAVWGDDGLARVDDSRVDAELDRFRASVRDAGDPAHAPGADRVSIPVLRSGLRARLRQVAWLEAAVSPASRVSDRDVDSAFAGLREAFTVPATVRARHLMLSNPVVSDPRAEIERLHKTVADGQATLAEQVQRNPTVATPPGPHGDLGYFSRHAASEEFAAAVWDLPVGNLSAPFQTRAGWHLAEVVDRAPARRLGFAEVAPELRARLESLRRRDALASLRDQLRSRPARHIERYLATLLEAPVTAAEE